MALLYKEFREDSHEDYLRMRANSLAFAIAALVALSPMAAAQKPAPAEPVVKTTFLPNALVWQSKAAHRWASLRVVGPDGFVHERQFGSLEPVFDLAALPGLADGRYKFEVVYGLQPDAALAKAASNMALRDDGGIADSAVAAKMRMLRETASGTVTVKGGQIESPDLIESQGLPSGAAGKVSGTTMLKDIVHLDDVIIDGSLCVGFDCANGESFGFDTLRLKENNLRIRAQDTSNSASFPTRDWQITFNETSNGGANKVSIDDIDGGRTPFTIEAGAPSNSLFVDVGGRIGIRTGTPVTDIHAKSGNTPALRFEQDGSSGFTPQAFDVAANEANFFIRDVTSGSTLPFP